MDLNSPIHAWEYYSFSLSTLTWWGGAKFDETAFNQRLNELGEEGWELVSLLDLSIGSGVSKEIIAVFKRARE